MSCLNFLALERLEHDGQLETGVFMSYLLFVPWTPSYTCVSNHGKVLRLVTCKELQQTTATFVCHLHQEEAAPGLPLCGDTVECLSCPIGPQKFASTVVEANA